LQDATQTIPIVFAGGGDAAVIGLVKDIARPEGNITGFSGSEPTIAGKWLELLKEAAPGVARVAIVFNPTTAPTAPKYIAAIESTARMLSVQTVKAPFRDAIELARSINAFAAKPDGGLLMLPPSLIPERATVLELAAHHRLPAIYGGRLAAEGGLISYGAVEADYFRRAASYVDRILHAQAGERFKRGPFQVRPRAHVRFASPELLRCRRFVRKLQAELQRRALPHLTRLGTRARPRTRSDTSISGQFMRVQGLGDPAIGRLHPPQTSREPQLLAGIAARLLQASMLAFAGTVLWKPHVF
jgi:ABC-type uncharacterized transport system substrate-binding protein